MNLDQIWQTAVDALSNMRKGGMKITRADLDAFVHDETKGKITSFAQLAQERVRANNVASTQEQQKIAEPSALGTGAVAAGDAMSFGLVNRMMKAGIGPGGFPTQPDTDTQNYMDAGAEAHPMADFVGSTAGGIPPAILAGEAMAGPAGSALAKIPGFSALPSLARTAVQGGAVAGGVSGLSSYAHSEDLLHPNPLAILKDAGMGAAIGAPLSAMGAWKGLKIDPSEHMLGKAVQEATPAETPSLMKGIKAIREGGVTPTTASPVLSDAEIAKLPEVLRPIGFERSPSLRVLGAKAVTKSAEAAAQAEKAIRDRIAAVGDAKNAIYSDTKTGYDAILEGTPIQNPAAAEIFAKYSFDKPVTARSVFDLEQRLARQSDHMFKVKETGNAIVKIDEAEALSTDADALRTMLGDEVTGFNDLQAKVAPYIQRQGQLRTALRQVVGRAIKPRGNAPAIPKGGMHEAIEESVGLSKEEITEKAARKLVNPLFRSTNTDELVNFITNKGTIPHTLARRSASAGAGAATGAAQSRTRMGKKVRGLFSWPVAEAQ